MTIKTSSYLFLVFVMVAGMSTIPLAFAADIVIPPGTSVPGCENTNECFIPATITINERDELTWINEDTAVHTVTSGTAADGPDGIFDSSMLMAGKTFSYTFEVPREYNYFCVVHPWMAGVVIVEADAEKEVIEHPRIGDFENLILDLTHGTALAGEELAIDLKFTDSLGNDVTHVNYDIKATQDGTVILDESRVYNADGEGHHVTMPVSSDVSDDSPVDVEVTFQGFGDEEPFTGPIGEVDTRQVVPEFGTIAMLILTVSIISIIAMGAKTRIIQKL